MDTNTTNTMNSTASNAATSTSTTTYANTTPTNYASTVANAASAIGSTSSATCTPITSHTSGCTVASIAGYAGTTNAGYIGTTSNYGNITGAYNGGAGGVEDDNAVELQRQVQKLEKLEKMINPNSKKSLILWEEDDSFKSLISSIVNYAKECDVTNAFPVELLDRLKALQTDVTNQITDSKAKVATLNVQATKNVELSRLLSTIYISAMAANSLDEYEDTLSCDEFASVKDYLHTIATCVPDSEEYIKAEKAVKSKIGNLENSVHITIDLERTTSKASALEYISKEIAPAVERLQAAYNAKYVSTTEEATDAELSLAVRKTFKEKFYDTVVKPIATLFKWKKKAKN